MRFRIVVHFAHVAISIAAVSAFSQTITIAPRDTGYLDDVFVVHIPDSVRRSSRIEFRGSNFESLGEWQDAGSSTFRIRPLAEGAMFIEVCSIAPNGLTTRLLSTTVNIRPDLSRTIDDEAGLLKSLRAAGRPEVFVRTHVSKTRAYVGETVPVWWEAVTPTVDEFGRSPHELSRFEFHPTPPVPFKNGTPGEHNGEVSTEVVRNQIVSVTKFGSTEVTAGTAGVVPIASGLVDNEPGWGPERHLIIRLTRPAAIDFAPVPGAAAGLPVGKFHLECSNGVADRQWPSFTVDLWGDSNLTPKMQQQVPRLSAKPLFAVVPYLPDIVDRSGNRDERIVRNWCFVVHTTNMDARIPPIRYRYFDSDASAIREAECDCSHKLAPVKRDGRPRFLYDRRQQQAPAEQKSIAAEGIVAVFAAVNALLVLLLALPRNLPRKTR